MRSLLTLLVVIVAVQLGFSQSKSDLISCLELAFSNPDMEKLVQEEWGESRTLYIVQNRQPNIDPLPFNLLMEQLSPDDFFGFPYEIELITNDQEELLRNDRSDGSNPGILSIGGMFRSNQLSLNIHGTLPSNLRKSILGSFVFEENGGEWTVRQSHVQVYP